MIKIIRGGNTTDGLKTLRGNGIIEETILLVVDQFTFLALLDRFNRQLQLLLDLIMGITVEIGNAGMNIDRCGDSAENVLTGLLFIIDEGSGRSISSRCEHAVRTLDSSLTLLTR